MLAAREDLLGALDAMANVVAPETSGRGPTAAAQRRPATKVLVAAPAALCCLYALGCVVVATGPHTPEQFGQATERALRDGDVPAADQLVAEAVRRYPGHGGVLLWEAAMAEMHWHFEFAARVLERACRAPHHGGLPLAEVQGRAGEKLFAVGLWGDSLAYLRAGAVGESGARRRALAALAAELPALRRPPTAALVRLPCTADVLPAVLVAVAGQSASFVFDTGATFTTVARSWAERFGVRHVTEGGVVSDASGAAVPVSFGVLASIEIGGLKLGPTPVLVVEDADISLQGLFGGAQRPPTCLLGLDVLTRFRVAVDPEQEEVALSAPSGLPEAGSVPCLVANGSLVVPVSIEGRSLWFILDTGTSHSSLTESGLRALPGGEGRAAIAHRRVYTPSTERFAVREVKGVELHVSSARFAGVNLPVLSRALTGIAFPVHGVLGADLFWRCNTIVDRGRMRMESR
jgi:predicted aspartyl protease